MSDMRDTWLVQRLEQPYPNGLLGGRLKDNPFSFGGGLKNGGLSEEAMSLLRDIFSFDYMGAAEFEFGEVPKALNKIANAKLEAGSFQILLSKVPKPYVFQGDPDPEKPPKGAKATIYTLAPVGWSEEIQERITEWATQPYNSHLKESTKLSEALRPSVSYPTRVAGWLELDNGFMFFTDEHMWELTCHLFGVGEDSDGD